ncbi:MAG: twin-arginine translocation signal domain-containing protein [Desulfobacteraceae bacterium]|nr:twin-arginine translocation signal domain-containing protein [Desulfobacteraceae bacterium]
MSNKIFRRISRRNFIKIAAATTATLAMDWKKIEAIAAKVEPKSEFR